MLCVRCVHAAVALRLVGNTQKQKCAYAFGSGKFKSAGVSAAFLPLFIFFSPISLILSIPSYPGLGPIAPHMALLPPYCPI